MGPQISVNIGSGNGLLPKVPGHYLKRIISEYFCIHLWAISQEMLNISNLDMGLKLPIQDYSRISQGPMSYLYWQPGPLSLPWINFNHSMDK